MVFQEMIHRTKSDDEQEIQTNWVNRQESEDGFHELSCLRFPTFYTKKLVL